MMSGKTIVVSAVNLRKGGTLTILRQCLAHLSSLAREGKCRVVALVHSKTLAEFPGIEYIELPWTVENWIKRLWCEYVTMYDISKQIGQVDLWLSLHDASPRVQARRQAVYCHTSFPFYPIKLRDFLYDIKIPLFGLFTRYVYRINQRRNRYIIVQQEWLRVAFKKMFALKTEQIILARADRGKAVQMPQALENSFSTEEEYTFFYASTADAHKDFQTLCRATKLLNEQGIAKRFKVVITLSGQENKYAKYLYKHWGQCPNLVFAGYMSQEELYRQYKCSDCFVFPSRIETWGLPISEYIQVHQGVKPIILPKLAYAYETSQGAERVAFFDSGDARQLAQLMQEVMSEDYEHFNSIPRSEASVAPVAQGWDELFDLLLAGL